MTNTPAITMDDKAAILLEEARAAHENYLIKQQDADLEKAIEYYIDAIKVNPSISESYYRLASLLLMKGQISIEGALEQCQTALTLEPGTPADLDLEMYVDENVPTVFYAQAFCAKSQLAKYLADKYNGLYVDIDDYASNSISAKIEAFLRLS